MGYRSTREVGRFPPVQLGKGPIVFLAISPSSASLELLITIDSNRALGMHKWRQEAPRKLPPFSLEVDSAAGARRLGVPLAAEARHGKQAFALTRDGRFLLSCCHWDFSFRVTTVAGGVPGPVQILRQRDVVTCISACNDGDRIVTGSVDSTVTVWAYNPDGNPGEIVNPTPLHILYGHDAAVNAVASSMSLDLVASASDDGTVIMHSLSRGTYIRSLLVTGERGKPRIEWLAVTASGRTVTYSDDFTLRVHGINGRLLASVEVIERLHAFCLSEDSRYIVYGGDRKKIGIRSIVDLVEVDVPGLSTAFSAPIKSCVFSVHERHLLVGLANGELWICAPLFS